MKIELLEDLYKQQVLELYDAERQIRRALNKMARIVSSSELQGIFRGHAKETKKQLDRLETVMERFGPPEGKKKSKAMAGLLSNAKDLLKNPGSDPNLLEMALSLSAQKVEAFEIFSYGGLSHWAKLLHRQEDIAAFEQTLAEEKRMSDRLAGFSESLTQETIESEQHRAAA
jgi:ferritin-like metal-binding protein YciE